MHMYAWARRSEARQGKARRDKTRHDETQQGTIREEHIRQDKATRVCQVQYILYALTNDHYALLDDLSRTNPQGFFVYLCSSEYLSLPGFRFDNCAPDLNICIAMAEMWQSTGHCADQDKDK